MLFIKGFFFMFLDIPNAVAMLKKIKLVENKCDQKPICVKSSLKVHFLAPSIISIELEKLFF